MLNLAVAHKETKKIEIFVSPEAARTYYKVAVKAVGDEYVLDRDATAKLRSAGR